MRKGLENNDWGAPTASQRHTLSQSGGGEGWLAASPYWDGQAMRGYTRPPDASRSAWYTCRWDMCQARVHAHGLGHLGQQQGSVVAGETPQQTNQLATTLDQAMHKNKCSITALRGMRCRAHSRRGRSINLTTNVGPTSPKAPGSCQVCRRVSSGVPDSVAPSSTAKTASKAQRCECVCGRGGGGMSVGWGCRCGRHGS